MRLRSRPLLFARTLADCATSRPLLRALLEQRRAALEDERAGEPAAPPVPEAPPLPRAA